MSGELGSLLGRWHQWRREYSHERGYSRARLLQTDAEHDDDYFEAMLMQAIEAEIEQLPQAEQLALQHVARAECLGVEVIMNPHLPLNKDARESLCQQALRTLSRRLENLGLQ